MGQSLYEQFEKMPQFGYRVIGFIDDYKKNQGGSGNINILGTYSDLSKITKKYGVSEIIIAMPSIKSDRIYEIIKKCKRLELNYRFVPNLHDILIQRAQFDEFGGIPLISYKEPKYQFFNRILKTCSDFLIALLIILITWPLSIMIMALIKIDSKGPVIFKQKRVGKNGKEFILYKFRTMHQETPKYAECPKNIEDPRITRVGKFLRKTSLDELPQFLNVLKGEMSVVGPRPEMPFLVQKYKDIHAERQKVKPGITGYWQISPYRSELIHENIDYDFYYIYNQNFILDMIIIFKTLIFAVRGI